MSRAEVISELGQNYNGSFDLLIQLTDMAFSAGTDYVKLQTRTPKLCVPQSEWNKTRNWFDGTPMTYIQYKERMELGIEQLREFDDYVSNRYGKGRWFTSVWDIEALNKVNEFELPFIKIPSAMLTNHKLISESISRKCPLMISTGMSTKDEIDKAVSLLCANEKKSVIMHTNSSYPTIDSEINLKRIQTLKDRYHLPYFKFGFSSHSTSPLPSIFSVFYGAEFIEAHVTLGRHMIGSDHSASLEKSGLELLCREVNRIPVLEGDGVIRLYDGELEPRNRLRPA